MKDRVPVNPGRVLITPENGNAAFYATMTRADNPTQEGTPLNKNTLLKDATAALFGLGTDAVPDDVLAAIKSVLNDQANDIAAGAKIATGSYTGTGTYGSSNPCSLTFDFVPKLVIVVSDYLYYSYNAYFQAGILAPRTSEFTRDGFVMMNKSASPIYQRVHNKTIEWYYDTAEEQLNLMAVNGLANVYRYVAFG